MIIFGISNVKMIKNGQKCFNSADRQTFVAPQSKTLKKIISGRVEDFHIADSVKTESFCETDSCPGIFGD